MTGVWLQADAMIQKRLFERRAAAEGRAGFVEC